MARSHASSIRAANTALLVAGDLDAIAEFFTPGYVVHLTDEDVTGGHATIRRVIAALRRAFPTLEVEVEILVEGKDRVAWQRTFRGKHEGDYKGFPATGRTLVWRDLFVSRFEDGRIAEDWAVSDMAERMLLARKR